MYLLSKGRNTLQTWSAVEFGVHEVNENGQKRG